MKASKLRGMSVVSVDNADKLGEVKDVLVDTEAQRVVGLELKNSSPYAGNAVPADGIHSVGKDAITVRGGDRGHETRDEPATRENSDLRNDNVVRLDKLLGAKVLSEGGDMLGTLHDVEVDPSNFRITSYELGTGPLAKITAPSKRLDASQGVRYDNGILMVPEESHVTEQQHTTFPGLDRDRPHGHDEDREPPVRRDRAA